MGKTFVAIEHANPTRFDVGAEGDSVGDTVVFSNDLYDEANANVVGTDQGFCFSTAVGVRFECAWSNIFDKLKIKMLESKNHQFTFTFELA